MATSLQPTRYESIHTIKLVASGSGSEFVANWQTLKYINSVDARVEVEVARDPTSAPDYPSWTASIGNMYCVGPTPESAKRGLAESLRKIAAELDESRIK